MFTYHQCVIVGNLHEILKIAVFDMSLKIPNLQPHLPGANELIKPTQKTTPPWAYAMGYTAY